MTRAGLPTTIDRGGTSFTTTLPAPTIELCPTSTPGNITLRAPIKHCRPIRVSRWRLLMASCDKTTASKVTIVSSPMWIPRGLVLSSLAENDIWQPTPISKPHTLTKYRRRKFKIHGRNLVLIMVTSGYRRFTGFPTNAVEKYSRYAGQNKRVSRARRRTFPTFAQYNSECSKLYDVPARSVNRCTSLKARTTRSNHKRFAVRASKKLKRRSKEKL
jgi:hypothetical protein